MNEILNDLKKHLVYADYYLIVAGEYNSQEANVPPFKASVDFWLSFPGLKNN